ncbi:MAG: restriction endonuclease subunit S [Candidatus Brocadiaceae bacterium]|nr:restriction endonuclease subunit S [Candidatus Brocadiaceae bacterium]
MGEWKTVKLAEVLRHRKINMLINNNEEYSLCRVQLHRRGVVLREKKMGSQIKTKKQQVCRAGDLIVAEMDAKFGGYGFIPDYLEGAIVSNHYYLYELDKSKITQDYFEILIKTDFIQNQIEAKGSTNYSSIRAWELLDYEIPLQSIAFQNSIASKYVKYSRVKEALGTELTVQLKYLSQLRQQILQEAIEGKLTAKWRAQHPELISGDNHASKLLEKIKAEKRTLTESAKHTKKDKPLPPITDAEKPFDLPEGWVWCRLGEMLKFSSGDGLTSKNMAMGGEYPVFGGNGINGYHDKFNISKPTIVIGRVGALCGAVHITPERAWVTDNAFITYYFEKLINAAWLKILLVALDLRNRARETAQPVISGKKVYPIIIGFPSSYEQQAIVERVDKIMAMIDELKKQVSERKEQSEMLMQSVLREAFAKG